MEVSSLTTAVQTMTFLANPQPVMDDITMATALLSVLPDTSQELVQQNLKPLLDTFTCFSELPVEIRIMIWKWTLPGRRVVNFAPLAPEAVFVPHIHAGRPLSARITCHESRAVLLEEFFLLEQKSTTYWRREPGRREGTFVWGGRKLVGVSPHTDLVYFNFLEGITNQWHLRTRSNLSKLKVLCAAIRSLDLRGFWFDDDHLSYMIDWTGKEGLLKGFTGLKELHLISFYKAAIDGNWKGANEGREETCVKCFRENFTRLADENPSRSSPDLYLHHWRRTEVRSDEENRTTALHAFYRHEEVRRVA